MAMMTDTHMYRGPLSLKILPHLQRLAIHSRQLLREEMGYEGAKESGRTATGSGSLMETEGDCRTSDGLLLIRPRPGKPGLWVCAGHTGHGMSRASVQHLPVMSPTPPQPGTTVADGTHVGGVEFFQSINQSYVQSNDRSICVLPKYVPNRKPACSMM
ncbi:hypothetical protein D9758_015139 [Tetrapyrgos nigripes]|uniref:Uncharacterized protein n=1 Tax=Tetrapyrgos nigripes TaxID=182062 RepID=A0A8H5CPL0_9AGAR|nr:hypothetical protein D9758_015139 [Tetrapyrgos nigripes]